jgi:pyruvate dehydrogenase E1 component beta subunit
MKIGIEEYTTAEYFNKSLRSFLEHHKTTVFFGQNVISGSRISGLGAKVDEIANVKCINTPNSENTLFGFGFGLALNGINSVYLMKQHDFSLLAIDHLVNTRRLLLNRKPQSTFLVVMVVVDSGYEGPQSNLNNLDDLHSISGIKVNLVSSEFSVDQCFSKEFDFCEIIALSQNSLKQVIYPGQSSHLINGFECNSAKIMEGIESPILVNFGLHTKAYETIIKYLQSNKLICQTFNQIVIDKEENLKLAKKITNPQRKVIVIDSSKSQNKVSESFCLELHRNGISPLYLIREDQKHWTSVHHDQFQIDLESVSKYLLSPK